MAVSDIFSKRQQRQSGQKTDVFAYEEMPKELRVQVVHIVCDVMGTESTTFHLYEPQYDHVHDLLAREYGAFELAKGDGPQARLTRFILSAPAAQVLDVVEVCLSVARKFNAYERASAKCKMTPAEAIKELNFRFLEAAFGFQYESQQIVRIDSQFAHAEIVQPALQLLSDPRYKGPQEEFLSAHKHYREGKHKECIVDCLKAFESTMKTIFDKRGWTYNKNDTANALIQVCIQNNLIDPMLLSHVGALRTVLEAGVPTVRNRTSGHGQGATPVAVPAHYASYALHLTAANILFLVNSEKALP